MIITILSGFLGKDAVVKDGNKGKYAMFGINVSEGKEESQWVDVMLFPKNDKVLEYLKKGKEVRIIAQSIEPSTFSDGAGKMISKLRVTATDVKLLPSRNAGYKEQASQPANQQKQSHKQEDDLTF